MTHLSEAILHNTSGINLILHDPLVVQNLQNHADFFVLNCVARECSPEMIAQLLAASIDTNFLVRPASMTKSSLQALLNLGIDGLVLPDIHHAAELEKVIASCLYPPEGIRPYHPIIAREKIALEAINDQITFVVDVAHPQTIAQLEEIAEVTGINGFLVSPQRLSVAMEKGGDTSHPAILQALKTIVRVAATYELPWGLEGENTFDLQPDFTLPTSDIEMLLSGLKADFAPIKDEFEDDDFGPVMLAARRE
jgi:2-keto-3-deoxy-L-rhamnonate aldolase RhmA